MTSDEAKYVHEQLRKARGLATTLRCVLEEVQSDLDRGVLAESEIHNGIYDNVEAADEIESWLDSLHINKDGTSADDGQ